MYLVDTDILGHLQRGHRRAQERCDAVKRSDLATSIITYIEIARARFESVLKAADGRQLATAQHWLEESERLLSEWRIVPFDEAACGEFDRLLAIKALRKIGRADLLIASLALATGAVLVTRNVRDFSLVTGLKIENWIDS